VLHVYTMEQALAFEEAARRNVALEVLEAATAFRMASDPKGSAWKKYVEHMTARTKKEPREEAPKIMTREQAAALKRMFSKRMN
jgi:hypothetical protein